MQFRTPAPVICLLLAAGSVFAQPAPTPLTSVALFRVQPDRIERFVEMSQMILAALEKLRQSGTIQGYGIDSDILHTQKPNVVFWFAAENWAGIYEGQKAVQSSLKANADKMKDLYAVADFDKHQDLLVRSVERGGRAVPQGVLPVTMFRQEKVKPGKMAAARTMFAHHDKPVLDQLVKDGAIYSYSMDVEAIHTMEPGAAWFLILAPDLAAQDKIRAAFDAAWDKLTPVERAAREAMRDEVCDRSAHRDSVAQALVFRSR